MLRGVDLGVLPWLVGREPMNQNSQKGNDEILLQTFQKGPALPTP